MLSSFLKKKQFHPQPEGDLRSCVTFFLAPGRYRSTWPPFQLRTKLNPALNFKVSNVFLMFGLHNQVVVHDITPLRWCCAPNSASLGVHTALLLVRDSSKVNLSLLRRRDKRGGFYDPDIVSHCQERRLGFSSFLTT